MDELDNIPIPEPRPCPFCGHRAEIEEAPEDSIAKALKTQFYNVVCTHCSASGPEADEKWLAASLWNDRFTGDTPLPDEDECDGYFELDPTFTVKLTKQSRKRDKKKKDNKRRDYAKYSYSPGAPRTKGDSEYVLPAKRSCGKRYMKRKVNHTVRRYKGYLPKGNGYRKMDPDLWMWW